jgi:nucleoside-diphosphate-sugar epimerase
MRVLVTGANGFIGKILVNALEAKGFMVTRAVRQSGGNDNEIVVGDLDSETSWHKALDGCDIVFHLAGRAHSPRDKAENELAEYEKTNVIATANLARQALDFGVKRFVYLSSVKVNGDEKVITEAFTETDAPMPMDAYGKSKLMAERILERITGETSLELVILRPPLVYGPGVKGNLLQVLHMIKKRIPLPLASIRNLRSLIHVKNLVDALILCSTHPDAKRKTYLVSDGEDLSVPDLLGILGAEMECPVILLPMPIPALKVVARLIGREDQAMRLMGSLRVESDKIRRELGWYPPYSIRQGLQETAHWYKRHYR